ncbi:hemerythrin domain-containing protein [Bdellovibrio bacteriovorus]|uniref:hemerythrin domain-containing protein n=1 Tax=Bdellovibrio bacteriovorus TaxID=959 RepID=UPI0021D12E50|nr:hemerythrin domain-containing protein [Bdellovibrio bacteriovorus]UXR63275.1 hemerythrin domain-containing protein [Bdellovibrio bacteriovorus]
MSQLTSKLKNDHKTLAAALEEIKALGISHPDAAKKLISAKATLLAHLKHEDVELYPVLKKAGASDSSIQSTLNVLAKDMETLAPAALAFFAKYEKGGDPLEFARDFAKLHSALASRIRREEESLYLMYDKVTASKAA